MPPAMLGDRVADVPHDRVIDTALECGLTAYDAEFVVLARTLGVPLATSDREILEGAPDVAAIGPRRLGAGSTAVAPEARDPIVPTRYSVTARTAAAEIAPTIWSTSSGCTTSGGATTISSTTKRVMTEPSSRM